MSWASRTRRVTLTDAGGVLLSDARATIERLDALKATAERLRSGTAGRVTIGVAPALPPKVLTDLLALAADVAPDARVVAKSLARPDAGAALQESRFDLVLSRGAVSAPGVTSVLVTSEPVGVALPQNHRLAPLTSIRAAALDHEPLATFPRTVDPVQFDRIFDALRASGLSHVGDLHESPVGAVEASLRLVAAGEALSIKLRSEVEAFGSSSIVWRRLDDVHLDVDVHVAWRLDVLSPAARRIVNAIAGEVRVRDDAAHT